MELQEELALKLLGRGDVTPRISAARLGDSLNVTNFEPLSNLSAVGSPLWFVDPLYPTGRPHGQQVPPVFLVPPSALCSMCHPAPCVARC